jgi:8-oxo-dGTP diphosphatase
MTDVTAASMERVDGWLADFREQYGEFDRVERSAPVPTRVYDHLRVRIAGDAADAPGAAGVWPAREDGAVLLVRRHGDDGWGAPIGNRKPGESFADAARRECREETGLDCRLHGLLAVTVMDITDRDDPDRSMIRDCIALFAGERVAGSVERQESEIEAIEWFTETPENVVVPEVAERPIPAEW